MGWLTGWSYAKEISLTGQTGAGTLYQVELDIGASAGGDFHLENHCTNFPQDIEITDNDGTTLLDFWIEDLTADPLKIWVEVADDLGSNQTIIVYYGKSGHSTNSNIGNTFLFGDDFGDGDYTSNPAWTVQSGSWSAANYYLEKTADDAAWQHITVPFARDTGIFELKMKGLGTSLQNMQFYFMSKETNFQNGYFIYFPNGSIRLYKIIAGSASQLDIYNHTTDGNWHDVKVERNSSGNMKLYLDETERISVTNTEVSNSAYMVFRTPRLEAMDTIRVRKYNSPEPAFSSAGAEQSAPVAGHPIMKRWGGIPGMQYTGRRSW